MAVIQGGFNVAAHNVEMGSPQLPLGLKMPVRAISSEIKGAASNNNNGYIEYIAEVLDGPNKGAQGSIRFNLYNADADAVRIAGQQLAAMAWCCGVPHFGDTAQLHNIPFLVDVTPQKVKVGQEDKGYVNVSAFYTVNGDKPKNGMPPSNGNANNGQQANQQSNQQGNANAGGDWNNNGQQQNPNAQNGNSQQNGGFQGNQNNNTQQTNQNGNGQQPDQNQNNNQQPQNTNANWANNGNNGGSAANNNAQAGGNSMPWARG